MQNSRFVAKTFMKDFLFLSFLQEPKSRQARLPALPFFIQGRVLHLFVLFYFSPSSPMEQAALGCPSFIRSPMSLLACASGFLFQPHLLRSLKSKSKPGGLSQCWSSACFSACVFSRDFCANRISQVTQSSTLTETEVICCHPSSGCHYVIFLWTSSLSYIFQASFGAPIFPRLISPKKKKNNNQ